MEKKPPTEIEQLLAVDHGNESIAGRVLDDFSSDVLEALNEAAGIFRVFTKAFAEGHDRRVKAGEYREQMATLATQGLRQGVGISLDRNFVNHAALC